LASRWAFDNSLTFMFWDPVPFPQKELDPVP
jgi:hypothetical protein